MGGKMKCNECGCIFDADEAVSWEEYRGEWFGFPARETVYGCPDCRSDDIAEYEEEEE